MSIDDLLRMPLGQDGAVQSWLACGPIVSPLVNLERIINPAGPAFGEGRRWTLSYWAFSPASRRLKSAIYGALAHEQPPVEHPCIGRIGPGNQPWRYVAVEDDRMADFGLFNFVPSRMQAWLCTWLEAMEQTRCEAELLTVGPARVWLDGQELVHAMQFSYVEPLVVPVGFVLSPGRHQLLIHGEMLGWREARLGLGLRFVGAPALQTCLPITASSATQWHQAEAALDRVRLPQFVVVERPAVLHWPPNAPQPIQLAVEVEASPPFFLRPEVIQLALPRERAEVMLRPGDSYEIPISEGLTTALTQLPEGHAVDLALGVRDGSPLIHHRRLWINRLGYSEQPHGSYEQRRREALEHLAQIRFDVMGNMAAVMLGRATRIDPGAIDLACHFLENRYDCADFFALSLLNLLYRFDGDPVLGETERERIVRAFVHFKYWIDEPGLDGMCYITENHQILFHVTAYLAGQLWPDSVFSNSGVKGRTQMRRARVRAENWIVRRLQGGFSEWDSNTYLAMDVFAMLSLIEFAESASLRAMATHLLNKIFFMIASQSFRGAHGSSHGRCYVEGLKTARADATSGLQRIAWGMGNFNGETFATGSLALARRYRVPKLLQEIGADLPDVLITRARSKGTYRPRFDIHRGEWVVRTITRRTPETMLSAAIDYRPGQRGVQEHLWQATLGPEAVVFTNYPGNSQEHGNARPNFWAGSVRLPRVALYERTVICHYALDPSVGLGFAHAYFPCAAFDEVRIHRQWAFARRGQGYVALWADGDLRVTETGRHADQELRSDRGGGTWVCLVGSAREDGDWADFCTKLEGRAPNLEHGTLHWHTPEGAHAAFGWEGPLFVNGDPIGWDDFPHYENAYTNAALGAEAMTIRFHEESLRIALGRSRGRAQASNAAETLEPAPFMTETSR